MSSILSLSSQGVVLATATAMAVSGTVILLALRLQKSFPTAQFPVNQKVLRRSCISSEGKKREKKKKKVHFAEDVVDPVGCNEEFRKKHGKSSHSSSSSSSSCSSSVSASSRFKKNGGEIRGMPANRVALYNGILRDRLVHRLAYSY